MTEKEPVNAIVSTESVQAIGYKVAVAPMMDWTDRHCRYFLRGFSPDVLLYTEMITAAAIIHGKRDRLLQFDPEEQPVALQLGGSDPRELALAARAGEERGYIEINLNCGCPSDRVHVGAFGACLMLQPQRVADCVAAMRAAVRLPVTVKMRIGVVEGEGARQRLAGFDAADYERLHQFTDRVREAGSSRIIVHARKAVLGGLSPRENREVPPLRYEVVQRLKADFPDVKVSVNGGLRTLAQCEQALTWADGVMLGREAYHRPFLLSELARQWLPMRTPPSMRQLIERMASYAERQVAGGERLSQITRHMLGLCTGQAGARRYRQYLSEGARAVQTGPTGAAQAGRLLRAAADICLPIQ